MRVMLLCYLERQLLVVHYIYCHVVQCRHSVLLTCIVKPARHYGRQTLSILCITFSVVLRTVNIIKQIIHFSLIKTLLGNILNLDM